MKVPHLTSVTRDAAGHAADPWLATCPCGWQDRKRLKRQAITAAEFHWLAQPLVAGNASDPSGKGSDA